MTPRVSVAMICYNQEPFLRQALDSVLAQDCDFDYEIVISDDASTDGSKAILDEYSARHSRIVRRDPPANVGMHENFNRVWNASRGTYIAILEGDDFWHDRGKLRRQVAFLDAHPRMTVCGHGVRLCDAAGQNLGSFPDDAGSVPEETDVSRLLWSGNYLQTCSLMYRRGVIERIPDWIARLGYGDYPLMLLHGFRGTVGFFPDTFATYRKHGGGVWSGQRETFHVIQNFRTFQTLAALPADITGEYSTRLKAHTAAIADDLRDRAFWLRKNNRHDEALRFHRELLRYRVSLRDLHFGMKALVAALAARLRGVPSL